MENATNIDPAESTEILTATSYLMKTSTKSKTSLYEHLSAILMKVLNERPENPVDILEDMSRNIKKSKFIVPNDTIQDESLLSPAVDLADQQKALFEVRTEEGEDMPPIPDDDQDLPLPDLMDIAHYFEQAGVGLSQMEVYRVFLALKTLAENYPLQTVRFWGKIIGLHGNYYIAETQYREGEDDDEDDLEDEEIEEDDRGDESENGSDEEDEDELPKSNYKPPPTIPREDNRTGANKYIYFVCSEPGKPWVKLPHVTPTQIDIARNIKKFFTGKLDAPIVSYPPFPGNESNYLRAQIARITGSCQISPLGYYHFDEDEDEDEDENVRDSFIVNLEFEGLSLKELLEPSLSNWVHHVQYLLPQGRCTWFNPTEKPEDDFEDEEDDEEREEPDEPEPETGPPLLTPISEDDEVDGRSSWTPYLSSRLVPAYACAVLRSNRWPGAYAFAIDRKFENIYIGFGHKYNSENYSPLPPPPVQDEFPSGADITEIDDPTIEEENALRAAQRAEEEDGEELDDEMDEEEEEDDD
ncbi:Radial spoke head protein 4-like protein A [Trichoplax sp. H2]|uniref:Radial spokehead-like protein n=1 Tax=Trichoplax adhaerens TaxID=10228 RepID=B3SAG7_TRIAD|nr:hypothetical protein TRIADDRAFT_61253 [Trichoplax adhaerens]EDV20309.1 hypothetical protein TRIADDRAFT_61253 [Trichoplax adhaerens]RDD42530.1 Radial spoke head protein 4-like protein A [Trichoplax sp. H2]|eukprot:XP_002117259.1 hypothetical protein TRIADDRAFT_61253 [Trichoplax adhaerens]